MNKKKDFLIKSLSEITQLKILLGGFFFILPYSHSYGSDSFIESAVQGRIESQLQLGFYFRKGKDKDLLKSYYWMKKAAKQGHPLACRYIAQAHFLGSGASKNLEVAKKWFLLSAKKGDVISMFTLGQCLENEKNLVQSLTWYKLAHEYGHEKAQKSYIRLLEKLNEAEQAKLSDGIQKIRLSISKFPDPSSSPSISEAKANPVNKLSLDNDSLYWGETANGLPHGYGQKRSSMGSTYQGEFKNGIEHGYGTAYDNEGTITYQGMWENGKPRQIKKTPKKNLKNN